MRVVVTGVGLVTPLGVGAARVWERLLAGACGVRALTAADLDPGGAAHLASLPAKVAARVCPDELAASPWVPEDARFITPAVRFALTAAAEALHDAGLSGEQQLSASARHRVGVAVGAGMSCTSELAAAGVLLQAGQLRRLSPYFIPRVLVNTPAAAISMAHGLKGPLHAASTACATGAHAVGDAFRMIQCGDAEVMLCGGTEACVDTVSLGGFSRLRALSTRFNHSPHLASRPFDSEHDGFVMGEGAGILVLEERQRAVDRGARIYAEVTGYGMSGDAHHLTKPPPDGEGAVRAMRRALEVSGASPQQVAYVNAHATSTPLGDAAEQMALRTVFGHHASHPRPNDAPVAFRASEFESKSASASACASPARAGLAVSSTKGATGHLLGAAGAVETVFTVLALHTSVVPPTLNLHHNCVQPPPVANLVPRVSQPLPAGDFALCNSFGFGGMNACVALRSHPPHAISGGGLEAL